MHLQNVHPTSSAANLHRLRDCTVLPYSPCLLLSHAKCQSTTNARHSIPFMCFLKLFNITSSGTAALFSAQFCTEVTGTRIHMHWLLCTCFIYAYKLLHNLMSFAFLVFEYYIPCYSSMQERHRGCHFSTDSISMPFAWLWWSMIDCSVKATIERYKKAHAVGSSSGAPLLELNAQVIILINSCTVIPFKPFLQLNKYSVHFMIHT